MIQHYNATMNDITASALCHVAISANNSYSAKSMQSQTSNYTYTTVHKKCHFFE